MTNTGHTQVTGESRRQHRKSGQRQGKNFEVGSCLAGGTQEEMDATERRDTIERKTKAKEGIQDIGWIPGRIIGSRMVVEFERITLAMGKSMYGRTCSSKHEAPAAVLKSAKTHGGPTRKKQREEARNQYLLRSHDTTSGTVHQCEETVTTRATKQQTHKEQEACRLPALHRILRKAPPTKAPNGAFLLTTKWCLCGSS
jgi:hypothetical protein